MDLFAVSCGSIAMNEAKDNAEAHYVSSATCKKQRKLKQEQAKSRLLGRLQSRSRKKLEQHVSHVVVPKLTTPEEKN